MSTHLDDQLSALADGQLSGAEAEAAAAHLAACPRCTAELAATRTVRALVRGLGPVEPRRPLVAVPPTPPRFTRLAGLVASAAAAVALIALSGVEQEAGGPQVANLVQVHSTAPVNADPMSQVAPFAIPASLAR